MERLISNYAFKFNIFLVGQKNPKTTPAWQLHKQTENEMKQQRGNNASVKRPGLDRIENYRTCLKLL